MLQFLLYSNVKHSMTEVSLSIFQITPKNPQFNIYRFVHIELFNDRTRTSINMCIYETN